MAPRLRSRSVSERRRRRRSGGAVLVAAGVWLACAAGPATADAGAASGAPARAVTAWPPAGDESIVPAVRWAGLPTLWSAAAPAVRFHGSAGSGRALTGEPATGAAYTPAQIRANYDLGPVYAAGLTGTGRTIGIVDVYGSPNIRSELATFDAHYGIPAPPAFTIVEPAGKVPPFNPSNGDMVSWAFETTLDVEWAHAMAPGADIVLGVTGVDEVEGTSGFAEITNAEQYLIEHEHVSVISQSFAATEETFPTVASLMALRGVYGLAETRRVSVLGASGDWGASSPTSTIGSYYDRRVVNWPASDPLVTAVGGTEIYLGSSGQQLSPPQVWNDNGTSIASPGASGGGISADFSRPSWQDGVSSVVGTRRGIPDVSLLASCRPGASIYVSIPGSSPGWGSVCGTSLATPMFAGIVVLADELAGHPLGLLNPALYRLGATHAAGLVDVTRGNNSVRIPYNGGSAVVTGYNAVTGYDLASGWGTVKAADLVPELAGKPLP